MRASLEEVAGAVGGRVIGGPEIEVTAVAIDSRRVTDGALFVALQGDRDGHDFVADAASAGAAAALVARDAEWPIPAVVVDNTAAALTALGRWSRDRLTAATVIGVTGSNGKTSTKDLTAAALVGRRTVASEASFNNELGVPLTLAAADLDTEAVVVEMGARAVGDIATLAGIVRPQIGIITRIAAAHTERFGSEVEIVRAKGELFEALPPSGHAVLGIDHAWADDLAARSTAPVVTVGSDAAADVRVSAVDVDGHLRPRFLLETPWGSTRVELEMRGAHQAANAGLAVAAAVLGGVTFDQAVAGVTQARSSAWRLEVATSPTGVIVVNDAYNANPDSTAAAIDALTSVAVSGKRWAVLGEMAELGTGAADHHADIGRLAAERSVDVVVAVGDATRPLAAAARDGGCDVIEVGDAAAALEVVGEAVGRGDAVLVKGSRVAGLERVAFGLLETGGGAAA